MQQFLVIFAVVKKFLTLLASFLAGSVSFAQVQDTTGVYGERKDTLRSAAVSAGQGNYISALKDLKTEVITAAGLCKMACCNLAESFENSASVTVGYSDAVTGARQIRLLGLSGTYTQMLDENRPVMRGLAAPFGLSYIPGQWLNSIQIAKGAPSVINGSESITGQINMEHRKPTDEIPLFINAAFMSDLKADLNVASSLQIGDDGKWSTVILGHISGNFKDMDMNGDGFLDDPRQAQINLSNRWLYYNPGGTQVRFGIKLLRDYRKGGQPPSTAKRWENVGWQSEVCNLGANAYLKVGIPLNDEGSRNIALVSDFSAYNMDTLFGASIYDGTQLTGFANLLYQDQSSEKHHFTLGLSANYDHFKEMLKREVKFQNWRSPRTTSGLLDVGLLGEYTFRLEDRLSVIAGLRADYYSYDSKFRLTPRVTVKYQPVDQLVLRFNGGRGLRNANPLSDNIGVLSTGKELRGPVLLHPQEDAWIAGANGTWYLPVGDGKSTYLSLDYFRTQFTNQLVVDYEHYAVEGSASNFIDFYESSDRAFTNAFQVDFSTEPLKRLTLTATFRYTDSRLTYRDRGLCERPMMSKYKGVLNVQYATNLNKWIFDFTASVNGPCRLYDFMGGGYSPVYPLLYAQVTHRMKGWDIYVGGENLTNYKQKDPIISAQDPWSETFDASCIWGPLMGIKVYAGVRITLWK